MRYRISGTIAAAFIAALATTGAHAQLKTGFADISWTYGAKNRPHGKDAQVIELEGNALFHQGEIYGLVDYGNINRSGDDYSLFTKGQFRYYLGEHTDRAGWNIFIQTKAAASQYWHEWDATYAIGYTIKVGNGWFAPYFGPQYSNTNAARPKESFAGWNGVELGFQFGYPFEMFGKKFRFTNWSEFDFNRDEKYIPHGASRQSINGTAAIWWMVTPHLTLGIKYPYAWNTLGRAGITDSFAGTVQYIF